MEQITLLEPVGAVTATITEAVVYSSLGCIIDCTHQVVAMEVCLRHSYVYTCQFDWQVGKQGVT